MANRVFIASAAGSGKTLSVTFPPAIEGFAGLDFVALFVVPTTHLLAQTHRLLLRLFHDVPSVQVLQAMDCLGATLYEDPALLQLDPGVVAELREHRASQVVGTDASTPMDDHLVKRLLGSLMERRATKAPDLRRIVGYGADKTSYIICGTPGIVSALLAAIESAPSADPGPRATASSSKLRHVERFTFSPEEASSYQSKLREIWHPKFRMPLDSGGGGHPRPMQEAGRTVQPLGKCLPRAGQRGPGVRPPGACHKHLRNA